MCGICGIAGQNIQGGDKKAIVGRMNQAMSHRGPDETGSFDDGFCSLAMSRLSIIDLGSGTQPIFNESGDICVFQNGEIYNYKDLQEELRAKGHHLQTQSDTEVIVHMYEEKQEDVSKYIEGMFAFCVYDKPKGQILISRDRFGEKPLYYYYKNGVLAFSSELKSLLESKCFTPTLDQSILPYYLAVGYVPEPHTLIQDVRILPPGHQMVFDGKELRISQYFGVTYEPDYDIKTNQDAKEVIMPALEKAFKRQMVSDVPIGAFLSGGIDSSISVNLVQKFSEKTLNTFTVKFNSDGYDESPIAREVAKRVGTNHTEINIPDNSFNEDLFWKILDHVGHPFPDSSAIPTYLITKKIREYVTVAISGDGGDEMFGGYHTFLYYEKILKMKKMAQPFRGLELAEVPLKLLRKLPFLSSSDKLRQVLKGIDYSKHNHNVIPLMLNLMFDLHELDHLLVSGKAYTDPAYYTSYTNTVDEIDGSDLHKIMYYRIKHNLANDMLVKVDRMSMANSLEVRAPYLDVEVYRAIRKLPEQFFIKNGVTKYILREIFKDDLPESVFNHPKKGFSIPLHDYFNNDFEALIRSVVNKDNPLSSLFNMNFVQQVIQDGLSIKSNNSNMSVFKGSHRLWTLLVLFAWVKRFNIRV